jgi:hypothetical protein
MIIDNELVALARVSLGSDVDMSMLGTCQVIYFFGGSQSACMLVFLLATYSFSG